MMSVLKTAGQVKAGGFEYAFFFPCERYAFEAALFFFFATEITRPVAPASANVSAPPTMPETVVPAAEPSSPAVLKL